MVPPFSLPPFSPFVLRGRQNPLSTPPSSVRRHPPPHPPPSSSTMPELIPRRRRPLQEIDLSHPRLRTGILASCPLASSPPSSTLPAPLLRPSRPPRPAATVYLLDLLPRRRQPSLPQHRQILSRCVHGAALEAVLFRIYSTYLSQQENISPLLYSDFL